MQWTMQAKLNAVNDVSSDLTNDAEQTRLFNEAMNAYKKLNEACGTLIAYEQNKYKS